MRIMREDYDKTSIASHQPAVRSGTTVACVDRARRAPWNVSSVRCLSPPCRSEVSSRNKTYVLEQVFLDSAIKANVGSDMPKRHGNFGTKQSLGLRPTAFAARRGRRGSWTKRLFAAVHESGCGP